MWPQAASACALKLLVYEVLHRLFQRMYSYVLNRALHAYMLFFFGTLAPLSDTEETLGELTNLHIRLLVA